MSSFAPGSEPGLFVPTTDIFDTRSIYSLDINSDEFKEFLVRLRQNVNDIALILNLKDSAVYEETEFINGQVWFQDPALSSTSAQTPQNRPVFRKVINFGALPNTGTTNVAHGLTPLASWTFTRIYGAASDTAGMAYIPLPFSSPTLAENVKVEVDATNVSITTGDDKSAFTTSYIILEYIKE